MAGCTIDELYDALGALILKVTGRPWWRKGGIQTTPVEPYATVFLEEGTTSALDVVERVELPEPAEDGTTIIECPWGTALVNCHIEFKRGGFLGADSAFGSALRFRSALLLSERAQDLWLIAGLSGNILARDISQMFRADIEGRAEVSFSVYANLITSLPLPGSSLPEIKHQTITVKDNAVPIFERTFDKPADPILPAPPEKVNIIDEQGNRLVDQNRPLID